jgi:hypothetical protein
VPKGCLREDERDASAIVTSLLLARAVSSANVMNPTWYCHSNKLADPTDSLILITSARGQVPEHC